MSVLHTFYLDESGNAGDNYLDDQQPFHVAAGCLISAANRIVLEVTMRSLLVQSERKIRKANELMRSSRGQRRVLNLLLQIGQARAIPFFIIMERRFAIAGKIVDVFLDPEHQDSVDWLPTSDIDQRHALTERILDQLDNETLTAFAQTYRVPNEHDFANVLKRIIDVLDVRDTRLRDAFKGALRAVRLIVEEETYGDGNTEHGDWAGLNVPSFAHVLRYVDRYMDFAGGRFEVVHDSAVQHEAAFRKVLGMFAKRDAPVADLQMPDGARHRGIYRNFESFRTASSTLEPALQAADVLCGAVAGIAKIAIDPSAAWSPEIQAIAENIVPALLMTDRTGTQLSAGIYAHSATKAALLTRLLQKH